MSRCANKMRVLFSFCSRCTVGMAIYCCLRAKKYGSKEKALSRNRIFIMYFLRIFESLPPLTKDDSTIVSHHAAAFMDVRRYRSRCFLCIRPSLFCNKLSAKSHSSESAFSHALDISLRHLLPSTFFLARSRTKNSFRTALHSSSI